MVQVLRKAFDSTMGDQSFVDEAAKINLDVDPLNGAAVEKLVNELFMTPKHVVERTREILGLKMP